MAPAGEDFEASEPARAQLYQRLEEGHDLVILNCSVENAGVVGRHTSHDSTLRFTSYTAIFCVRLQAIGRGRLEVSWRNVNLVWALLGRFFLSVVEGRFCWVF